jgi:cold-inducible RNA-binding protein
VHLQHSIRCETYLRGNQMKKLYVGNLTFAMTDDSLSQLFTEKGYKVSSARIITDRETGRSRGFGFVELGEDSDASKAIGEMNGLDMGGRALQVSEAREQESRGGGGNRFGVKKGYSGGGRSGRGGRGGY